MTVSVVICAHTLDRRADLRAALWSAIGQSRRPDEVLLVIDHNDELLADVAELADDGSSGEPPVRIVANNGPKGLSGARNTGTELAVCDIVAYLDDDAVAHGDWLAQLVEPYGESEVVSVGGWANPAWDGEQPPWFPDEFAWVVGCSHRGLPTARADVRNVIGCNMSFRRAAVLEAGGFDTGLGRTADRPLGCEETELCIRIRQREPSARIVLEPNAEIDHRVPEARGHWRYFFSRCRAEGNSKAYVSRLVGTADGLSSERAYVASVLPRAVVRALLQVPRTPLASLGRMLAIIGGVASTGGGYLEYGIRQRI